MEPAATDGDETFGASPSAPGVAPTTIDDLSVSGHDEPRDNGPGAAELTDDPIIGEADPPAHSWQGSTFEPYAVGDPGRASADVVPRIGVEELGRPDTSIDAIEVGRLSVRAASTRGLSHRYYGRVRQDEYCFGASQDADWFVAAVADGVSAGELSHRAAVIAVRSGCRRILAALEVGSPQTVDWQAVVEEVGREVENDGARTIAARTSAVTETAVDAESGPQSPSRREIADLMASTLLYAVMSTEPAEDGNHVVLLLHLGDTSAWVLRGGADWEALQAVKNDGAEIASSATAALPLVPSSVGSPTETRVRHGDALVLMTDGVGDPLATGAGEVGQFLAKVWATPPTGLDFAAQMEFARRSFDDDRTVVAIWPQTAPR